MKETSIFSINFQLQNLIRISSNLRRSKTIISSTKVGLKKLMEWMMHKNSQIPSDVCQRQDSAKKKLMKSSKFQSLFLTWVMSTLLMEQKVHVNWMKKQTNSLLISETTSVLKIQLTLKVSLLKNSRKLSVMKFTLTTNLIRPFQPEILSLNLFSKEFLTSFAKRLTNLSLTDTILRKTKRIVSQVYSIFSVSRFSNSTLSNNFALISPTRSFSGNSTTTCSQWSKLNIKKRKFHGKASLMKITSSVSIQQQAQRDTPFSPFLTRFV